MIDRLIPYKNVYSNGCKLCFVLITRIHAGRNVGDDYNDDDSGHQMLPDQVATRR